MQQQLSLITLDHGGVLTEIAETGVVLRGEVSTIIFGVFHCTNALLSVATPLGHTSATSITIFLFDAVLLDVLKVRPILFGVFH